MAHYDEDENIIDFLSQGSPTTHFTAERLHDRHRRNWAVISHPSGAIAENEDGGLLMQLTEEQASMIAADLSARIGQFSRS